MTTAPLWLVARVVETRNPTPHGRVLELRVDGWPGNLAGQHVDVRLTAEAVSYTHLTLPTKA